MPMTLYTEREYNALQFEIDALRARINGLEALRPTWAMGYTSDSVAAQTSTAALQTIWGMLNVNNQTEAMQRIAALLSIEQLES